MSKPAIAQVAHTQRISALAQAPLGKIEIDIPEVFGWSMPQREIGEAVGGFETRENSHGLDCGDDEGDLDLVVVRGHRCSSSRR